ncbi:BRO family protein [Acinetobacter sp. YH12233]|uniref:BRO family protein n=1 Tax=Acinetobacter sp. YH12233 TaxID=2601161 RepID=UPI00211DF2B2|nr:BRO family protein [Acinetobacter sp. YH12233]
MSSLALSFNEVNFSPVERDGQIWLTAGELARALGYAKANAVTQVYERNQDEFNSSMTNVIDLNSERSVGSLKLRLPKKENNLVKTVRIFSLRGAHLIAMFSKTAIAKKFRKWVLDVLDREVVTKQLESRQNISPEQKDTLHKIVDHKVNGNQGLRAQVWTRHNRHFKINSYHELLAIHFEDAVKYLLEMEVKQRVEKEEIKALPYPQEVIQVAQQISQEFNNSRYDSWHVSARNGVLTAMPLPPGFYPTMDIAEFTKRFDSVLDLLYGTDTLRVGRHFLRERNSN